MEGAEIVLRPETERKKIKDKEERERILANIEKDKRERAARAG